MRNPLGCTGIFLVVGSFVLPSFPAATANAAGTGLCWDVRVRAHVPCGSNPVPSTPSRPSYGPSAPSGPSPQEIERRREEEEFEREQAERRRKEEERRAREEAERERRRLEDQARERREFLKSKSEALESLKGVDFDGSRGSTGLKSLTGPGGLKSGTPTFGTQPNPGGGLGLKSLDTSPAEKEPLFSKGTKYSAPVDLRDKDPDRPFLVDPRRIAGLVPNGDLAKFVARKPWPPSAKSSVLIGLVQLERGRPSQAAWFLRKAQAQAPKDEFLRDALAGVASEEAKAKRTRPEIPREAAAAILVAAERRILGDTETAIRMVRRAAELVPNAEKKRLQSLLWDMEREQAQKRGPYLDSEASRTQRLENAARWAKGIAAYKMGMMLAARSEDDRTPLSRDLAMQYMGEAHLFLPGYEKGIDENRRSFNETKSYSQLPRKPYGLGTAAEALKSRDRFYASKSDALLDALEYGKGDPKQSIRYLDHALRAFPYDPVIREALHEFVTILKPASGETVKRKNP